MSDIVCLPLSDRMLVESCQQCDKANRELLAMIRTRLEVIADRSGKDSTQFRLAWSLIDDIAIAETRRLPGERRR